MNGADTDRRYLGCYENKGPNSLVVGNSVLECEGDAIARGNDFFGLTQGSTRCAQLTALQAMVRVADSECESEIDGNGNRLGGTNRLAVYVAREEIYRGFAQPVPTASWQVITFDNALTTNDLTCPGGVARGHWGNEERDVRSNAVVRDTHQGGVGLIGAWHHGQTRTACSPRFAPLC